MPLSHVSGSSKKNRFLNQKKNKRPKLSKKQAERVRALAEVQELFAAAGRVRSQEPAEASREASRLVRKARRLSMRFRLRLPAVLKRRFCRNCNAYLVPGKNCRVRLAKSRVIYLCLDCKHLRRFPVR